MIYLLEEYIKKFTVKFILKNLQNFQNSVCSSVLQ